MKRSIGRSLTAMTAMAACVLAGCSSGSSNKGGGPGSASESVDIRQASTFAAAPPASLVSKAKAEGGVLTWYESTPDSQVASVMNAFEKKYPFAHVSHVKLAGAALASRVAQESQAGSTADIATDDAASIQTLTERAAVEGVDWGKLGIPRQLTPTRYGVVTAAVLYALLYNKNSVTGADIPKNWNDLLDPKWKGKLGAWVQPFAMAELVPAWGAAKVSEFVRKFAAQRPMTYQDTFPLAQGVGADEVSVALGIYHSAQPAIASGAPIGVNIPDPAAVTLLYSFLPKKGKHPATAQLFINWLDSQEGATAYEQATYRGNPLLPGTKTGALVKGKKLSDFGPNEAAGLLKYLKQFATVLQH